MKNITRTFVVCAALFACSSLFGAPTNGKVYHHTGRGYHKSGLIGQVGGPTQFVIPVDVLIMSGDGQYITDFLTAPDGSFEVYLKPGTYVLVAYFIVGPLSVPGSVPPAPPSLVFGTPVTVTVEKKQFESAVVPLPSGPIPAL